MSSRLSPAPGSQAYSAMSLRELGIREHFSGRPICGMGLASCQPSASGLGVCIDSLHRTGQGRHCSLEPLIKRDPIKSLGPLFAFVSRISAALEPLEVRIGLTHLGLSIGPQPSLGLLVMALTSHDVTSLPDQ